MELALRVTCTPDTRLEPGNHKHKCDQCGTVWFHNGPELQERCTSEEFRLAHDCPNCGTNTRKKYYHERDEAFECDGLPDIGVILAKLLDHFEARK